MSEKPESRTQAKLPSSARSLLLQYIAELGACSPETLDQLGREVAAQRHARCLVTELPCDACNAREAVCGILREIAAGARGRT